MCSGVLLSVSGFEGGTVVPSVASVLFSVPPGVLSVLSPVHAQRVKLKRSTKMSVAFLIICFPCSN